VGLVVKDDGWRMPDWLWERIAPLLPLPPSRPLGCHRPRVLDRDAMERSCWSCARGPVERAEYERGLAHDVRASAWRRPESTPACCLNGHQAADTKRTHQKRHARRLATPRHCLRQAALQEKLRRE
jgi:hypothetical protein